MSTKTSRTKRQAHAHHGKAHPKRPSPARPATASQIQADPTPRPSLRPRPKPRRARRRFDPSWGQLAAVAAVFVVGGFLLLGGRSNGGGTPVDKKAPPFTLMSTSGSNVSLSDYRGRNVLLYFNEGVGCDACFYQTVELEKHADQLKADGITLLPIVVNPIDQVEGELGQLGITTPYLIDATGQVSSDYGMMGKGMHANLPGHGFVFIDRSGQIRWEKDYPSMYASTSELLGAVKPYLG